MSDSDLSKLANPVSSRLAVCSWSLQPETPAQLIEQLRVIGLSRVQLDLDPLREQPSVWSSAPTLFAQAGIEVVSGMFRTVGEDYSTLESIRRTGGLVPDSTWEQNWANLQTTAKTASQLGLRFVMFHAGFVPHDTSNPTFVKLVDRIRQAAQLFAEAGITLGCETGQETGPDLKAFLEHLAQPNVAVNFDPANMILYNNGDPLEALRLIAPWVKSTHLKDANLTAVPGTWGEEVVLGTGQVDWGAYFSIMGEIGFEGEFCIEREAGEQRVEDIRAARLFVEKLLAS
jgi:sugar phosphate isomerase/epimerase